MTQVTKYFVRTPGIALPDGSVFGAGTQEAFLVVGETGQPGFLVYEVIGGNAFVNIFGSGNRVSWRQMKQAIDERIAYQIGIGNKVLRGGKEITEV